MKKCITCKEYKEISTDFFYKSNSSKDGLQGECKECLKKRTLANRLIRESENPILKEKRLKRESERMARKRECPKFREEDIKAKRKFYWDNKQKINSEWKKYYFKNRESLINKNRELESKRRKIISTFTNEEWEVTKNHFMNKCAYCGSEQCDLTRDHVLPISKGGYNVQSNIVPSCKSCNSSKKDKDMEIWFKSHEFYDENRLQKIYDWMNQNNENLQMALF